MEELPRITCHRTMWVAGGSPIMLRPCLTCYGRAQGQDKRASGPGNLYSLPPEVVIDPVLLVYSVSVYWEWTRAFHGGSLSPEQEGREGLGVGVFISRERLATEGWSQEQTGRLQENRF